MSKTVSFVARDELAEWLESQADEEMKTISSVVQDIVAENYRRNARSDADSGDEQPENPLENPPFTTYPDAWYEPETDDSDEIVAVRIPESADLSEDRRYYKTYEGAAKSIRRFYG